MPKNRELSIEKRAEIITLHREGYTGREISNKIKIPQATIAYTIRRHSKTGSNASKKRTGRPRATTKSEDKYIQTLSKRNRRLTASQLLAIVNKSRPKPIGTTTVKDRLKEAGLRGCIALKKTTSSNG